MSNLLIAQAGEASVGEALQMMVVGMVVVFAALILLLWAVGLVKKVGEEKPKPQPAAETKPTAPVVSGPTAGDLAEPGIGPELIAVLAAAATAVVHRPVRIQRVRFVGQRDDAWAAAGRMRIMGSHRPSR